MFHQLLIWRLILALCVARVARLQSTLDTKSSDYNQHSNFLLELKELIDRLESEVQHMSQENRRQQCATDATNHGTSIETGCPSGFTDVTAAKKCYKLVTTKMSWSQAGFYCASMYGAHLVFVANSVEQTHLSNLLDSYPETIWWTGGERFGNGWGWKKYFANGTIQNIPIGYTNWCDGEPNNVGSVESCIALMKMAWWEGRWNDDNCAVPRRFICEIDVKN